MWPRGIFTFSLQRYLFLFFLQEHTEKFLNYVAHWNCNIFLNRTTIPVPAGAHREVPELRGPEELLHFPYKTNYSCSCRSTQKFLNYVAKRNCYMFLQQQIFLLLQEHTERFLNCMVQIN
jgi:hypothetical protein